MYIPCISREARYTWYIPFIYYGYQNFIFMYICAIQCCIPLPWMIMIDHVYSVPPPDSESGPCIISKLGGYYIRLKHLSCIIPIKTLLKHIKTLLYQLKHLQFFDYYIILYHMSEINYYINYITTIISIIFICVYYCTYIN